MESNLSDLIRTAVITCSFVGGIWAFLHNQVEAKVQASTQTKLITRELETIKTESIELKTEISAINNRLNTTLIDINKTLGSLEGKIDAINKQTKQ